MQVTINSSTNSTYWQKNICIIISKEVFCCILSSKYISEFSTYPFWPLHNGLSSVGELGIITSMLLQHSLDKQSRAKK